MASPLRLAILRQLSQAPDGLAAGVIAERLRLKRSTLSNHLARLERAGLVAGHRSGRIICYRLESRSLRFLLDSAWRMLAGPAA